MQKRVTSSGDWLDIRRKYIAGQRNVCGVATILNLRTGVAVSWHRQIDARALLLLVMLQIFCLPHRTFGHFGRNVLQNNIQKCVPRAPHPQVPKVRSATEYRSKSTIGPKCHGKPGLQQWTPRALFLCNKFWDPTWLWRRKYYETNSLIPKICSKTRHSAAAIGNQFRAIVLLELECRNTVAVSSHHSSIQDLGLSKGGLGWPFSCFGVLDGQGLYSS